MSQSVAVADPVEGGKRGELFGGALTDEALDSSRSVLGATRFGTRAGCSSSTRRRRRGVHQAGDRPAGAPARARPHRRQRCAACALAARISASGSRSTAIRSGPATITRSPATCSAPFRCCASWGCRFPQIVANPPFGLTWTDGAGRPENSTVAAWRMSLALLAPQGVGAFICGRDRFRREVLSREDAAGVFATVECDDLFDGVALPCLIAFFVGPEDRSDDGGLLVEAEASKEELAERALSHEIKTGAAPRGPLLRSARSPARRSARSKPWRLVGRELERRRREEASQRPTYAVELRARDRLAIRPGPFVRQALAKAGRLKLVETLHNQPVGHFALNALDWRLLGELEQECDLSISPAVREAVAEVADAAEREVIPLYEVRPQMRLGYLTDLDSILCTRSDPERGFQEGERYPLRTDSRINVTTGKKVTRNKQGEPVVRKYEEEAKVLVIKVADKEFSESTEDIQYLLEHFEIPNPGDIATRFPEEVERQRQILDEIAADGRANGKDPRVRVEALPARGPGARPDQDPRRRRVHPQLGAGRRQDPRRRRLRAGRGAQRRAQPSPVHRPAGPHPAVPPGHLREARDRGRAHHHARPGAARRKAPARRRRGLVHHPLRGALAARRQERGAARPGRAGSRGRGRARRAGLHRILPGLPRLLSRRLADGQPARLLRGPHRGGQRRDPQPQPADTSTSACASRAPRTISPAPSATA